MPKDCVALGLENGRTGIAGSMLWAFLGSVRLDPYYACSGTSFCSWGHCESPTMRSVCVRLGNFFALQALEMAVPVGPTLEWTFEIALGFGASSESSLSEIPDLTFDIDDTFPTTATLLTWRNSIALFDDISSNIALDNVCARYPTQLAPRNRPSANPTLFLHCCPRVSKHPPFALHKLFTGALGKNRRG